MRRIARQPNVRELILDAVDVLLGRYGYGKMTVDDVAREVGIGKGTIYLHFESKEELALAHVDRIAAKVATRLREISMAQAPLPERLRAMLVARVLIRFDSVVHYSRSLGDLLSSVRTALLARRKAHFATEATVVAEVLRDGIRAGLVRRVPVDATARALIEGTNALLPFNLAARELGARHEIEERVTTIADLLVRGLSTHRSEAHRRRPRRVGNATG